MSSNIIPDPNLPDIPGLPGVPNRMGQGQAPRLENRSINYFGFNQSQNVYPNLIVGGTTDQINSFKGFNQELVSDIEKKTLVFSVSGVNYPLLKEDQSNIPNSVPNMGFSNENQEKLHINILGEPVITINTSGNVGINASAPAVTLVVSASDAIRVPRGTAAQRPSPASPGYVRFNTTAGELEYYKNSEWVTNFGNLLGPLSWSNGGVNTYAHSLGRNPKRLRIYFKAKIANNGYSLNEELELIQINQDLLGCGISSDGTNVYLIIPTSPIGVSRSTLVIFNLLPAQWDLYIRAE